MNTKGFTLIELLVTIMLVAVLATYSIFAYLDSIYEAENKQAKSKLELISSGFDRFYIEYPDVVIQRGTFDNAANTASCLSSDTSYKRLVACNYVSRIDFSAQKYEYRVNGPGGADCSGSPVYMVPKSGAKTGKFKGSYCAGISPKGEAFDQF